MLQHPDQYRDLLVLFSVIIVLLSCFSALDLAERLIREKRGPKFILMLSCFLGTGMWSMHFIGMRAMRTDMAIAYDLPLLLLSLIVPVAASYALFCCSAVRIPAAISSWLSAGYCSAAGLSLCIIAAFCR